MHHTNEPKNWAHIHYSSDNTLIKLYETKQLREKKWWWGNCFGVWFQKDRRARHGSRWLVQEAERSHLNFTQEISELAKRGVRL